MCQETVVKAQIQTEDKSSGGEWKRDQKSAHEEESNEGLTLERETVWRTELNTKSNRRLEWRPMKELSVWQFFSLMAAGASSEEN